jgi:hypothetical protein
MAEIEDSGYSPVSPCAQKEQIYMVWNDINEAGPQDPESKHHKSNAYPGGKMRYHPNRNATSHDEDRPSRRVCHFSDCNLAS